MFKLAELTLIMQFNLKKIVKTNYEQRGADLNNAPHSSCLA